MWELSPRRNGESTSGSDWQLFYAEIWMATGYLPSSLDWRRSGRTRINLFAFQLISLVFIWTTLPGAPLQLILELLSCGRYVTNVWIDCSSSSSNSFLFCRKIRSLQEMENVTETGVRRLRRHQEGDCKWTVEAELGEKIRNSIHLSIELGQRVSQRNNRNTSGDTFNVIFCSPTPAHFLFKVSWVFYPDCHPFTPPKISVSFSPPIQFHRLSCQSCFGIPLRVRKYSMQNWEILVEEEIEEEEEKLGSNVHLFNYPFTPQWNSSSQHETTIFAIEFYPSLLFSVSFSWTVFVVAYRTRGCERAVQLTINTWRIIEMKVNQSSG